MGNQYNHGNGHPGNGYPGDDNDDPTPTGSEDVVDISVNQDVDLDVDFDSDTNSSYSLDINGPWEDVCVNYNVNVNETKTIDETQTINFTENMTKDIDVDIWNTDVNVTAENIIQNANVTFDTDVNDLDIHDLVNVSEGGTLSMDGFNLDVTSIGNAFNGGGNDGHYNINQTNNLEDNDSVHDTTVVFKNEQAPNVDADAQGHLYASEHAEGGYLFGGGFSDETETTTTEIPCKPKVTTTEHTVSGGIFGAGGYAYDASLAAALAVDVKLTAPTQAFQTAESTGGTSEAGDGIGNANLNGSANDNEGNGTVSGDTSATADASASAEAFTSEIMAGGNQQANFATLDVIGGNQLDAGDLNGELIGSSGGAAGGGDVSSSPSVDFSDGLAVKDASVTFDDDPNDVDLSNLLNVGSNGHLDMDSFNLDVDSLANSFNGAGNDMAFDVTQANDLVDNDCVTGTYVGYEGTGWNGPFQDVSSTGGMATAGDGIGCLDGCNVANSNGGNGLLGGTSSASADAISSASAFTSSIVVGANLQLNNMTANVVGGDASMVDDIDHSVL